MSNPFLAQVLGEEVVPVLANVPRSTFRSRMKPRQVQRTRSGRSDQDSVRRVIGEAREEELIPDDAQDISSEEMVVGKPIKPVKDVVQEPSYPVADKEKYLTPYSALTAPDVTPQALQPIDPSTIPGGSVPETFRAGDIVAEPESQASSDVAASAMNVLLGKSRAPAPAPTSSEFKEAGNVVTAEQAESMLGINSSLQEGQAKSAAVSALVPATDGGSAMPPPAPASDGKQVCSVFRRFVG